MKPCELTPADVAVFCRLITDRNLFDDSGDISQEDRHSCANALAAARSYAAGYAGLDLDRIEFEDVSYAILAVAAEMVDNHQMTGQYTGRNPTAAQILDMHSTNLLPSAEDES